MKKRIFVRHPPDLGSKTIIYGVLDPRTKQLRYIGKTRQLLRIRITSHLRSEGQTHRQKWFAQLRRARIKPDIFEIERVENWREAERFWISYFRSIGCKLVNSTFGGDGLSGAGPTSFKPGQPAWNKGKKWSAKTRRKIAAAGRRRVHQPWTQEMRDRHRETMRRVCNVEASHLAREKNGFQKNPRGQRKRKVTGAPR